MTLNEVMSAWLKDTYLHHSARIYFFLSCILNMDAFLGPYRPVRFSDGFEEKWVYIKTSFADLWASGLIAWNPNSMTGNHALLLTLNPFNPLAFLTQILPLWACYSLWLILSLFIAGYGLHLYLTKTLRLSFLSSYLAAFFFVIFLFRFLHIEYLFLYAFPLFLYAFEECLSENKNRLKYLMIIFLLLLSSSPVYTVPHFAVFHLVFIVSLTRPWEKMKKKLMGFFLVWFSYAFIHAPVIYALLSELPFSNRLEFSYNIYLSLPITIASIKMLADIVRAFSAAYFLPLSLALLSVLFFRKRIVRLGWGLLIVTFGFVMIFNSSLGSSTIQQFPIIKALSPDRFFMMIYHLIICILSGYGVRLIEKGFFEKNSLASNIPTFIRPNWIFKFFLPLSIFLAISVFYALLLHDASWITSATVRLKSFLYHLAFTLLFLSIVIAWVYPKIKRTWAMGSLAIFLLFILFFSKYEYLNLSMNKSFNYYFGEKNITQLAQTEKENQTSFRVALNHGKAFTAISPTLLEYHGFQTADGIHPMYSKRFKKVWAQMIDPSVKEGYEQWQKDHLTYGVRVYLPYSKTGKSEFNIPLLSLLNVKYIFSTIDIHDLDERELSIALPQRTIASIEPGWLYQPKRYLHDETNLWIYKVNTVLPRSFVVSNWQTFEQEEDLLQALRHASAKDHLTTVLFLKSDLKDDTIDFHPHASAFEWSSNITKYTPNKIKIQGYSSRPALLILTDNFHRNWKAKVNGSLTPILPAYYTLRAVKVTEGNFSVDLYYEDKKLAIAYSLIPLGLFILLGLLLKNRQRNTKS